MENINSKEMLKFINKREITVKNYKSLPDINLQQMALCAKLGFGEQYTTSDDFLTQTGLGNILEGYVQIFDVVEFENPQNKLYECFIYNFDNADLFNIGTITNTNAVMRKAGTFTTLANDENTISKTRYIQMGYHGRNMESHQTARKIGCEHLRPLEAYLKNLNIAETLRGVTWSEANEWVYFNCILNATTLKSKLNLGDTIKIYDYNDPIVSSEYGLVCEQCGEAIIGLHPRSNNPKGIKKIS